MQIRAELVERLHDLPPDIDVASALLRIALQARTAVHTLPDSSHETNAIGPFDPSDSAGPSERRWLKERAGLVSFAAPLQAVMERVTFKLAPDLLADRTFVRTIEVAAFILLVGALMAGWFAAVSIGLGLAFVASAAFICANLLRRLAFSRPPGDKTIVFQNACLWFVLVLLIIWSGKGNVGTYSAYFTPIVLMLALVLCREAANSRLATFASDNMTQAALLLFASLASVVVPVAMILTLIFLTVLLFEIHSRKPTTN